LTGVWSPTAEGFAVYAAKGDDLSHSTGARYRLIGFCSNGFDMLYQPVGCNASSIGAPSGTIELSAACRVKDYPLSHLHIGIRVNSGNTISFSQSDFANADFSISGDYRRCSRRYTCVEGPDPEP
jgi:hypothetical protein